jgi:hypothetical protein
MKNEPFFATLSNERWAIFISKEFLSDFVLTDEVKVCNEVLYELWGHPYVDAKPANGGYILKHGRGIGLYIYGFRVIASLGTDIDKIALELKDAVNFVRDGKISAFTADEVLEMGVK